MSYDILTEEFGGQVQCAKVSAKSGLGIDELLEKVLLQVRPSERYFLGYLPDFVNMSYHALVIFFYCGSVVSISRRSSTLTHTHTNRLR
jgi:translation elongation factor EF-4